MIGRIAAAHGLDGKIIIEHSLGSNKGWEKVETIFIEENKNNLLPWFLTSVQAENKAGKIIAGLEGVSDRSEALPLLKKSVWLTEIDYKRIVSGDSFISLLGYEVYNGDNYLGIISEVVEQSVQPNIKVLVEGKEVWIPLHADLIVQSDPKQKKLFMKLPDGLLDVYLK